MPIERLAFDSSESNYHPMEAGIHVSRYQLARNFVAQKRVLDIACGEGYGSWLLKQWGAKQVVGVDIAEKAIDSAQRHFSTAGIEFICADAESILCDEAFDLIISLETIEHVSDQHQFLSQLKKLLAPNGVIILSCPNDEAASWTKSDNPFHLRKYTFKDFITVTESVFGQASDWLVGTTVFGYGNFHYNRETDSIQSSKPSLSTTDVIDLAEGEFDVCHNYAEYLPNAQHSLYYVGIWGATERYNTSTGTVFPLRPLNVYINEVGQERQYFLDQIELYKAKAAGAELETIKLERDVLKLEQQILHARVIAAENDVIKNHLTANISELTTPIKDKMIVELQQKALMANALQINNDALNREIEKLREKHDISSQNILNNEAEIQSLKLENALSHEALENFQKKISSLHFISQHLGKLLLKKILPKPIIRFLMKQHHAN